MSLSSQLFVLTGAYLSSGLSLMELATWVQDHEELWASLKEGDEARHLAGTIMLATYEVDYGHREEESARELIREAAIEPATPQPRR